MAYKTENSKTSTGASISTIGGSNVTRATVRTCHKQVVATAEIVGIQDGVRVEVHLGTRKTRCGTRRNGVHYEEAGVHILGINPHLYGEGWPNGFSAQGRETLAHEMIHADQFSSGRCKRTGWVERYGSYQMTYTFTGSWNGTEGPRDYDNEVIPRPRNPSYKTYRNFAWEQEAFECQAQVARQAKDVVDGVTVVEAPVEVPIKIISDKPFCCPHCGKGFGSRQGRYNHIKKNACGRVPQ